jgi:hypothetical protein
MFKDNDMSYFYKEVNNLCRIRDNPALLKSLKLGDAQTITDGHEMQ